MLLNGRERLVLLNAVLPPEGNLVTMKLVIDVRQHLTLGEAEFKILKVTDPSQPIGFDALEDLAEKEVEIGTVLKSIIVDELKKRDKDCKLTPQHMSLYAKFVETA